MRYALVYGPIAGAIAIIVIVAELSFKLTTHDQAMWFGYLVMLVALSLIFVGVKRYRDVEKGGVIRFLPAFGLGLAIAAVAAITYSALFEIYLAATDYAFFDNYLASIGQSGADPAEAARQVAEMESYRPWFESPLIRPLMVFAELFPVGLVVALVSAALLRNPRILPARPLS